MGRARLACLLLLLLAGRSWGAADSLSALPSWDPTDPEAGLHLTPHALAVDPIGRVWVLDRSRGRILRPQADGAGRSLNVGGREGSAAAPVADMAISGAFLYLLEPSGPSIALLDLDGAWRDRVELAGSLDEAGRPGFLASRLLVGSSGDLWLFEPRSGGLLRFDRRGRFLDAPLEALAGNARPVRIADAALTPDDGIVILDAVRGGILPLDASGAPMAFEPLVPPPVEPSSIAVDAKGRRYVLEAGGRLRILDPGGALLADGMAPGVEGAGQRRLAITGDHVLCAADPARGKVLRWRVGSGGSEDGER
jgi:streptogramin lyase